MRRIIVFLTLIALAGCLPPVPETGPEADYQSATVLAQEKKYREAVSAYRRIASGAPESPEAADALFQVAYLHVCFDNPQRDYGQALAGFDEFLKRYPDHPKAPEAHNWRLVLKTALDIRKENDRLKRSIELLKELDIRHEQRRTR